MVQPATGQSSLMPYCRISTRPPWAKPARRWMIESRFAIVADTYSITVPSPMSMAGGCTTFGRRRRLCRRLGRRRCDRRAPRLVVHTALSDVPFRPVEGNFWCSERGRSLVSEVERSITAEASQIPARDPLASSAQLSHDERRAVRENLEVHVASGPAGDRLPLPDDRIPDAPERFREVSAGGAIKAWGGKDG